jgi:hypothetical protein
MDLSNGRFASLIVTAALFALSACSDAATVVVVTATPSPRPPASPTPPVEPLRLLDVDDGGTLVASIDTDSGFPVIGMQAEARGTSHPFITLDADGLRVALRAMEHSPSAQTIPFTWTPWHGNGEYRLDLRLVNGDGEARAEKSLTVAVSGIPDGTPTMQERFIQLYQEAFGLNLTSPAFAYHTTHVESAREEQDRWISVAYIEGRVYSIYLFDNGEIAHYANSMSTPVLPSGVCWPTGVIRILVLIVDYDNTNVAPETVRTTLDEAAEEANRRWADYAASIGLAEPILEMETTVAIVDSPPTPGEFLTPAEAQALTGHDPAQFDLLAEIDLDAEDLAVLNNTSSSGGFAFLNWCQPNHPQGANLGFAISERSDARAVGYALYEHELMHLMGWMHWWPNGDGSSLAQFNAGRHLPYLLYGWTDTDGDGMIEIYDPTPYGLGGQ